MSLAITDIFQAIQRWQLVIFIGLSNVKARYRRSVLGPLWLTLGTVVGAAGLGFLWSELLKVPRHEFVPSLTAGLIIWQFVSGVIMEGVYGFSRQAATIKNTSQPYFIHPMQVVLQQFVNFLHNIPVFFLVAWLLDVSFNLNMLWVLPCLILLILNLLWLALLLGILGARFRDIEFIINMVMPLLLFTSPVFYRPNYLPFSEDIMWFNPFSHLIELIRHPLLGSPPPDFVVLTNLAFLVVGWTLAVWLFNRKYNSLAFWL
jgi:ABC-type polysaccharide/polyol phosphate export permease